MYDSYVSVIYDTDTPEITWYYTKNISWYLILDTFLYQDTYHDTRSLILCNTVFGSV